MAFVNISQKIRAFLGVMREKNKKNFTPISKALTQGTISPGDVVYFRYSLKEEGKWTRGERVALVVGCIRGPGGFFISRRNNKLLSSFKLDDKDPEVVGYILKQLYKNRKLCDYHKIVKSLSIILGMYDFRTYKVAKCFNIHEFKIIKADLPTISDEEADEHREPEEQY